MRLVAVEQFQVQVAAGFVGEALEKFARQAETNALDASWNFSDFATRFWEKAFSPRQTSVAAAKIMTQRARHSSMAHRLRR